MKVHVAWSPIEFSSSLRSSAGLIADLTPDGKHIVWMDAQEQRITLRPSQRVEHPRLAAYLASVGLRRDELRRLVGEVHLPGGQELTRLLLRDVLNVFLLSEEPPGNDAVPSDLPLPLESISVFSQGPAWPGYERASLEPDGDILVNHVIMASVIPPPPP